MRRSPPFLSIVIPSYKSQKSIIPLLSSIYSSQKIDRATIEIIVVDDKSPDESLRVIEKFEKKFQRYFSSIKIIALKENRGPAHARNIGVKSARGEVILFLDSDVVLYKSTLHELISSYKNDPDLFALTGVWSKTQKTKDFFPKFKALRDWSYWINERDPRNYYYLFSTRIASIRRSLFLRLGGFDETYQAALVEDIELTYRIAKRHAVIFNPNVIVFHEFEGFAPVAKKYFWRSYYWGKIYRERKKFDPVATTSKEAVTTISAGGLVFFLLFFILYRISFLLIQKNSIFQFGIFDKAIVCMIAVSFFVQLWGVRKFLTFAAKEEGIMFAVKSFFMGIILYLIIFAGAIASYIIPHPNAR